MALFDFLGSLVKPLTDLIDDLHTSDEEKATLKNEMFRMMAEAEEKAQEQVTRRWEADQKSSLFAKNVRPGIIAFLTFMLVILSFFDGNVGGFTVNPSYVGVYETLLMMVYGAYFAGRTVEKIKKANDAKV